MKDVISAFRLHNSVLFSKKGFNSHQDTAYFLLILLTNTVSICVDQETRSWEWSKIKLFILCQLTMPFDFSLFKPYIFFQNFAF